MEKIHILQVIGSLKIGGAEKVALSIIQYIDRDKYQVDYLVYDDVVSEYTSIVENLGGNIYRINNYTSNPIKMRNVLYNFFINNKFDIVHSHLMFHNGVVISAAKKAGIKKIISHSHSTQDGKGKKTIANFIYKFLMKSQINKDYVYKVACGYKAGCYLYGKRNYEKKGIFFKNRIDGDLFAYSSEKRERIRQDLHLNNETVFLIVGHLVPLKNHKFAFDLFERYLKHNNNSVLYVLGDGFMKDELNEMVKSKRLEKNIIFTGNVHNVYDYMIAADHLLLPSIYEGFPVTLVEAQALGLHCLVSNTVTSEVDFTGLISWCSLKNETEWLSYMDYTYNRENQSDALTKKGFDLRTYSKWINEFYDKIINC